MGRRHRRNLARRPHGRATRLAGPRDARSRRQSTRRRGARRGRGSTCAVTATPSRRVGVKVQTGYKSLRAAANGSERASTLVSRRIVCPIATRPWASYSNPRSLKGDASRSRTGNPARRSGTTAALHRRTTRQHACTCQRYESSRHRGRHAEADAQGDRSGGPARHLRRPGRWPEGGRG
jgi:hypothetical protein